MVYNKWHIVILITKNHSFMSNKRKSAVVW